MEIIRERISRSELKKKYTNYFGTVTKAVVDLDRKVIAVDAELHSDLEAILIEDGSKPESLWGVNIYPSETRGQFIEFIALINIRPSQDNYSMEIQDFSIRKRIGEIIFNLIDYET